MAAFCFVCARASYRDGSDERAAYSWKRVFDGRKVLGTSGLTARRAEDLLGYDGYIEACHLTHDIVDVLLIYVFHARRDGTRAIFRAV